MRLFDTGVTERRPSRRQMLAAVGTAGAATLAACGPAGRAPAGDAPSGGAQTASEPVTLDWSS
ncbi:MAG: hypothetical protein ACRDJN_20200 [Chloroflexota bacterium]